MIEHEANGQPPNSEVAASRKWFEQQAECLRSELHQRCQALLAQFASLEQRVARFEQRASQDQASINGSVGHKTDVSASLDERFASECLSQEHNMRESQFAEIWLQLSDEKNARQQFQRDIEGRLAASHTSVEDCLAYLEGLLHDASSRASSELCDVKLQAAARCDELSAQAMSHQDRFQQLEDSQQRSVAEAASGLDSLREQLKHLVKEAAEAAVLQSLQTNPEISGSSSSLLVPEQMACQSQVRDVTAHLEGVVNHLETHKASMEAHQRHVQDSLSREQAAREAFEQAFRDRFAVDRRAQPLQLQQVEVAASLVSCDEATKHESTRGVFVREINDLMALEKASREEGYARFQERLTWERVERERHSAKFEEALAGQEALSERRHRQSLDRLDALSESVGICDGSISVERKERTAEMRRIWDALDSHRHTLCTDSVLKSAAHSKCEADVPPCGLREPLQSKQAFRTSTTRLYSPRLVHPSSSVACGEVALLQQLPQQYGGGAARQVVRQNSTPSLLMSATPRSPRVHFSPSSRLASSSAPRISGGCLSSDASLPGRSLCAPVLSSPPASRGSFLGHTVFHRESPRSMKT